MTWVAVELDYKITIDVFVIMWGIVGYGWVGELLIMSGRVIGGEISAGLLVGWCVRWGCC